MDKWQIAGILLILVGVAVLAVLAGFIFTIIVTLLKLLGVFVGIALVLVGVALLTGRHFMRRRSWFSGSPAST